MFGPCVRRQRTAAANGAAFRRQRTAAANGAAFRLYPTMEDLQLEGTTDARHPFLIAARRGDVAEINRLLAAGVSPDLARAPRVYEYHTFRQMSALAYASGGGNYLDEQGAAVFPTQDKQEAVVVALLRAGASPNPVGCSPLAGATSRGFPRIVRILLEAGSNPNASTYNPGQVPLFSAATECEKCVELLLAAGADVNAAMQYRSSVTLGPAGPYHTALDRAIREGMSEHRPPCERLHRIFPLLLRAGATFPRHSWHAVPSHERRRRFPYLKKILRAGSFAAYEKEHTDALVAIFLPKFPHLNADVVRHIMKLWAHCGYY